MWPYWIGILIGLLSSVILGIITNGCASSIGGVAIVLLALMAFSGQAEMLFLVVGPESWRNKIEQAGYRSSTLFLAGLTAGSLPIAITFMLLNPNLQGPSWLTFGLPLFIFAFGVPVGSWIALFALSRVGKEASHESVE